MPKRLPTLEKEFDRAVGQFFRENLRKTPDRDQLQKRLGTLFEAQDAFSKALMAVGTDSPADKRSPAMEKSIARINDIEATCWKAHHDAFSRNGFELKKPPLTFRTNIQPDVS